MIQPDCARREPREDFHGSFVPWSTWGAHERVCSPSIFTEFLLLCLLGRIVTQACGHVRGLVFFWASTDTPEIQNSLPIWESLAAKSGCPANLVTPSKSIPYYNSGSEPYAPLRFHQSGCPWTGLAGGSITGARPAATTSTDRNERGRGGILSSAETWLRDGGAQLSLAALPRRN